MEDFVVPEKSVIQYIRGKKRVPYGVVVAAKTPAGYIVGYSLCNKKDRFSKKTALKIAFGRANKLEWHICQGNSTDLIESLEKRGHSIDGPYDVGKTLPNFLKRCNKYYKTTTIS